MNEGGEKLLWAAIGAFLAGLAALWATAALAIFLFGGGWEPIPVAELPAGAVRLLSHLGDPALAWPPGRRRAAPGAVGFWLCAVLMAALLAALAVGAIRAAERLGVDWRSEGVSRAPSSRWAKASDLRPLRVRRPEPGRLTLGRHGRSLIAAEERRSVIVIAPTQSHKTTGLAIPAILEWEGPVIATSVKSDLLLDTLARRESMGKVMVFDPTRSTGLPTARATPLWGARTWQGAMRVAHWIVSGARLGSASGLQDADFWFTAAEKLVAPLLLAAVSDSRTMAGVVRWLEEGAEASEPEVLSILRERGEEDAERAYIATQNREERQRSSIYTTAELALAAFGDPVVAEETAGSDYSPAELLDGGSNTLYLCSPLHEQERLRAVFSQIVQELIAVIYETVATTGRPLDPPILGVFDEAANIAPIPNHDEVAATAAGQGIQIVSIYQDVAQINARYGRRAPTILNNHTAKILGPGISDPDTLSWASRVIGTGEFEQRSRTDGERGRRTTTQGDTYRDLAPAGVLREGEPSTAVLIYGRLPPAQIRLRPWFRESSLRKLREGSSDEAGARKVE